MNNAGSSPPAPALILLGALHNFSLSYLVFVLELHFRGSSQLPAEIGEYDCGVRALNLFHKSQITEWDVLSVTVNNLT